MVLTAIYNSCLAIKWVNFFGRQRLREVNLVLPTLVPARKPPHRQAAKRWLQIEQTLQQ